MDTPSGSGCGRPSGDPLAGSAWDAIFQDLGAHIASHMPEPGGSWAPLLLTCRPWSRARPARLRIVYAGWDSAQSPPLPPSLLTSLPTSLRELRMRLCRVRGGWGFLERLTNLRTLDLYDVADLDDEAVRQMCGMDNLRRLTALAMDGADRLTDAAARLVSESMPDLVDLNAAWWNITDGGLAHICNLSKLEHLRVGCVIENERDRNFTRQGYHELLRLEQLKTLRIEEPGLEWRADDAGHPLAALLERGVAVWPGPAPAGPEVL